MNERKREPNLFDQAREDRTAEMLKEILERLERIEGLLREIRSNQPELSEEESPGEEEIDELVDEF